MNLLQSVSAFIYPDNNHNIINSDISVNQQITNFIPQQSHFNTWNVLRKIKVALIGIIDVELEQTKLKIELACKEKTGIELSFQGDYACYVMFAIQNKILTETKMESLLQSNNPYIVPEPINYLLLAIKYNLDIEIIRTLLESRVNPDSYSFAMKQSHLSQAIENNRVDLVEVLLQFNADPNSWRLDENANTPLGHAVEQENNKIFELLIAYGANPNRNNIICHSDTPLLIAIDNDNVDIVKRLLELGADVNGCIDCDEPTPLYYAAKKKSCKIMKILLESGANPNKKYGYSILLCCIKYNNEEAISLLMEYGADINARQCYKNTQPPQTALFYAFSENKLSMVELLLKHGADINANQAESYRFQNLQTPLVYALIEDKLSMVEELLKYGADINAKQIIVNSSPVLNYSLDVNKNKLQTPLFYAINYHQVFMIETLLQYGANPNIKHGNITAIEQAVAHRNWGIAKTLRRNLARLDDTKMMSEMIAQFGYDPLRDVSSLYQRACIIAKRHYQYSNISQLPLPQFIRKDLQQI